MESSLGVSESKEGSTATFESNPAKRQKISNETFDEQMESNAHVKVEENREDDGNKSKDTDKDENNEGVAVKKEETKVKEEDAAAKKETKEENVLVQNEENDALKKDVLVKKEDNVVKEEDVPVKKEAVVEKEAGLVTEEEKKQKDEKDVVKKDDMVAHKEDVVKDEKAEVKIEDAVKDENVDAKKGVVVKEDIAENQNGSNQEQSNGVKPTVNEAKDQSKAEDNPEKLNNGTKNQSKSDGTKTEKTATQISKAREIRLEQNRKAARESRKRKKIMIEELQRSVIFFSRANAAVKQQNEEYTRLLLHAQSFIQQQQAQQQQKQQIQSNHSVQIAAGGTDVKNIVQNKDGHSSATQTVSLPSQQLQPGNTIQTNPIISTEHSKNSSGTSFLAPTNAHAQMLATVGLGMNFAMSPAASNPTLPISTSGATRMDKITQQLQQQQQQLQERLIQQGTNALNTPITAAPVNFQRGNLGNSLPQQQSQQQQQQQNSYADSIALQQNGVQGSGNGMSTKINVETPAQAAVGMSSNGISMQSQNQQQFTANPTNSSIQAAAFQFQHAASMLNGNAGNSQVGNNVVNAYLHTNTNGQVGDGSNTMGNGGVSNEAATAV